MIRKIIEFVGKRIFEVDLLVCPSDIRISLNCLSKKLKKNCSRIYRCPWDGKWIQAHHEALKQIKLAQTLQLNKSAGNASPAKHEINKLNYSNIQSNFTMLHVDEEEKRETHVMLLPKWFFYRARVGSRSKHFTNELQLYVAHKTNISRYNVFPASIAPLSAAK